MPFNSHKLLALTALLALSAQNASAFVPNNMARVTGTASTSLFAESSDVSIDYDAAAKLAYDQWRVDYKKGDFDSDKFSTFKANYAAITIANVKAAKKAREEGGDVEKLELNDFADMTAEEYMAMNGGGEAAAAPVEEKVEAKAEAETKPKTVMETAMDQMAAQDVAASAISEAADAIAEEEQKLMKKLGLKSVEELEVALDSMEGIAADGGELDPTNVSREARVRAAYLDWCKDYSKDVDEARYPTFQTNYLAMEEYAQQNGKTSVEQVR